MYAYSDTYQHHRLDDAREFGIRRCMKRLQRTPDEVTPPEITERVVKTLDALQRHPGGLSTDYLCQLIIPNHKHRQQYSAVLKALYHHSYLDRPHTLNHPRLLAEQNVYRLDDKGINALAAKGKLAPYKHPAQNDPTHDYMTSCITASIEIAVTKAGLTFIPWYEILNRAPEATQFPKRITPFDITYKPFTRTFSFKGNEFSWEFKTPISPDAMFGIDYGGSELFFALEADRNSEDGFSTKPHKNTLASKVIRYQHIMTQKEDGKFIFQKHFGIEAMKVLFVTMPESRVSFLLEDVVKSLIKLPARLGGAPGCTFIAAKHIPYFRDYYTPPVMDFLFTEPWKCAGTEDFNMGGARE